jgi:ribose transport system substrate-binding protein
MFAFRRSAALIGAALVVTALQGCGSDDEQEPRAARGSADVEQYERAAREVMQPVDAWRGPTEGPRAQPGKRVMFLSCGFAAEGCKRPADAAREAGEALGWDVDVVDGKFDPKVYNRAIQQAVDQRVDAILLNAISSEAVAESLKRARGAGIPVGSWDSANEPSENGVSFEVDVPNDQEGRALASYMIWKTEGDTTAYLLHAPEFKATVAWVNGAKEALEGCPTCRIAKEDQMAAADAASRVPQITVASLRENPDINTVIGPYDAALLAAVPSMQQAGVLDRVNVGAFNGISPWLEFLRQGRVAATVAEPQEWGTWAMFDNVNRILAGQKPVEQNVPIRLITAENIGELPTGEAWQGDVDFRAEYRRIWSGSA